LACKKETLYFYHGFFGVSIFRVFKNVPRGTSGAFHENKNAALPSGARGASMKISEGTFSGERMSS
jgi:hypothetical protein